MACSELTICDGVPARLFRISFSGELAFELAVPRRYGHSLMEYLMTEGQEFGAVPYGVEALGVMRIEKGHAAGNEFNGQTTALNLGLERMLSTNKDFIGKTLSQRPGLQQSDASKLMGFVAVNRDDALTAGAHFVELSRDISPVNDLGWMSSVAYSPMLGRFVGLGFIKNGLQRRGDIVRAVDLARDRDIEVEIVSPHFVDPDGSRLRG
jgi:sarcosine oxidase subunit alpha